MVSKKTERELIGALRRMRLTLPLTTALTFGAILPSAAAAEEVEAFDAPAGEIESEVEAEVNEDSLRFLLLVDTFETAERIPTSRLSTPAEVVVITADEIDANHYQTVEEAISHVTGVVALNSPAQNLILVSGNRRVLVLVNGRRTFMHPPMKAIERIEIVKGGGSALYGSDAVGGVINIITKRGDHNETTVDINTGSWHRHTYEITNQGNDGKLGWFIDAAIGKSRPYNYGGSEPATRYDKASDYDDRNLMLRLDHRFDERNSLTFDVMHNMHRYNQYNSFDPNDWNAKPQDALRKFTLRNQVSLSYNFKEGTSTPGFLRYFNNYESYDQLFRGGSEGNSRLQGVDYQNGWELGQHKLIVGVEWHQDSGERDSWQEFSLPPDPETGSALRDVKRKVTNQAYYIQDTISMGQKWTVVPGTRVDHNSQFGSQWSPKIAANYSPDDQTKIFASWGRVYQAPSSQQLYTDRGFEFNVDDIPFRYERWLGNSNLKPETGHTETIGIEHDFSDKVNASLSLFNAKISSYLDLNDVASRYANAYTPGVFDFYEYRYVNSREDKQHGVNLTYRQKFDDHWSYNLGYAYTHRKRPLGDEAGLAHERAPKNSYMASIRYQNGPWRAALMGVAGTGSGGNNYMEDDFAFLDFNISCEVSEWATIYAKAINFTNQNRSYYGRRYNMPGRLFQVGLDCRF